MSGSQTPPLEAPSGILGAEWRLVRQSRSWGTLIRGRASAEGAPLIINILAQQGSVPELRSLNLAYWLSYEKKSVNSGVKVPLYSNTCIPAVPPKGTIL